MIDERYWGAIVVASILGTSFGDFVSNTLELGFAGAALAVGSVLAVIFIAERTLPWSSVIWYWGAVVFTRTAATDLADYFSHPGGLHLGNGPISAIFGTAAAAYLIGLLLVQGPGPLNDFEGGPKRLPRTNTRYWVMMLTVSCFGTAFGDFVSDDLGLGLARGAMVTGGLLAVVLFLEIRAWRTNELRYWVLIGLVRTAGTVIADYMTEEDGLNLGFGKVATLVCVLLLVILLARRGAPAKISAAEAIGAASEGLEPEREGS
jgi:uncharacterized membrane-anchored protein